MPFIVCVFPLPVWPNIRQVLWPPVHAMRSSSGSWMPLQTSAVRTVSEKQGIGNRWQSRYARCMSECSRASNSVGAPPATCPSLCHRHARGSFFGTADAQHFKAGVRPCVRSATRKVHGLRLYLVCGPRSEGYGDHNALSSTCMMS